MMTFQAMYRGMLLLLAVGGTAILQSSAAPEKGDLSVAEKVESFVEHLEELIDGQVGGDENYTMDMMEKNGDLTKEFGGDSWLPETRQVGCSSGYRMRNGVCYKAFNTRKNFHDASSTCVAEGGTLAMPKDAGTNAFLLSLKNAVHRAGWFWFGLVDHHREGSWEWIDGTPLGFRAWGPGEPNNAGDEDCAEYFPTAWNDAQCSRTDRKFICQKIPTGCPTGYVYHQPSRQCYKAFNEKRTYSGAVAKCSADRGTLAMPRDAATNKFLIYLKNAVDINGLFRFGLTDNHQEGGWRWANNIPLGPFKAWAPGEPNNYANEDCAEYNAGIVHAPYSHIKNMWNDFECSNANRKFICQVSPGTTEPVPLTEQTAKKYAPKVWLAKGEAYNPSSVAFHLRNVKVYNGRYSSVHVPSNLFPCSETCYMSSNQRLDRASGTLPFFSGERVTSYRQPPVYAVAKQINPTTADIFYWMFYPYNRGKRVCIGFRTFWGSCAGGYSTFGHHVGDWEHMKIRLENGQPRSIYVSAHNFGGEYYWDAASQTYKKGNDVVRTDGTHPILYSAKGSHGLWSTPGTHTYKKILINEKLQDETSAGTAWDTWKNVPFTMYRPRGGYTGSWTWLNYRGRWGNRKSGCTVEKLSNECILNDGPKSINYRPSMLG